MFNKIKIEKIDDENQECSFYISTNNYTVNTIRRIMISEIETFAISKIKIKKWVKCDCTENKKYITNPELLESRIGQIPIYSENISIIKEINKNEKNIEIIFNINKTNFNKEPLLVTSNDLITTNDLVKVSQSGLDIPILTLYKGESINLECICTINTGQANHRWSPVSVVSFFKIPIIKINDDINKNLTIVECNHIKNLCHKNLFDVNEIKKLYIKNIKNTKNININITNENTDIEDLLNNEPPNECSYCGDCLNYKKGLIKIEEGNYYKFIFEPIGQLSIQTILLNTFDVIKKKIEYIHNNLVGKLIKEKDNELYS